MHGEKVQNERTRILQAFLAGEYDVLVCTGVLGRGLDLRCVKQVGYKVVLCRYNLSERVLSGIRTRGRRRVLYI